MHPGPGFFELAESLGRQVENIDRARICEFLEVDASESIVERCLSENSFERLTGGRERGVEDPRAFFRLGVAGDWRRVFNAGDHAAFGQVAGEALTELGYESEGVH